MSNVSKTPKHIPVRSEVGVILTPSHCNASVNSCLKKGTQHQTTHNTQHTTHNSTHTHTHTHDHSTPTPPTHQPTNHCAVPHGLVRCSVMANTDAFEAFTLSSILSSPLSFIMKL